MMVLTLDISLCLCGLAAVTAISCCINKVLFLYFMLYKKAGRPVLTKVSHELSHIATNQLSSEASMFNYTKNENW